MLPTIDMTNTPDVNGIGAQTWIFQGNPDTFDITAAVTQLKEIVWLVTQYRQGQVRATAELLEHVV